MGFKRTIEDFACDNCGAGNRGDGYTNHCTRCLHSKHVDIEPGDRAATCHGLMVPVEVHVQRDRWTLVHRCVACGYEQRCRTATGDDIAAVLAVARAGPGPRGVPRQARRRPDRDAS